jgi:hypothetical protein
LGLASRRRRRVARGQNPARVSLSLWLSTTPPPSTPNPSTPSCWHSLPTPPRRDSARAPHATPRQCHRHREHAHGAARH